MELRDPFWVLLAGLAGSLQAWGVRTTECGVHLSKWDVRLPIVYLC